MAELDPASDIQGERRSISQRLLDARNKSRHDEGETIPEYRQREIAGPIA